MFTYFLDIETSTIVCDNNEEVQVTYLTNILKVFIDTGEIVSSKFFRTISDTIEYLRSIDDESIVWCHNLDYELTFILRELGEASAYINDKGDSECILRDIHSPLSIKLDYLPNLTFRDTYAIFNKSIKQMGEEIGLEKLEYDYEVIRLPWDELTKLDYDYNERDNIIACKYLFRYLKERNITFNEVPLTFTSMVKTERKCFINKNYGKEEYARFYFHRNSLFTSFDFFNLCMEVYQGGLTTSNVSYTNKLIKKIIYSIDIKSSYPNQMVSMRYPVFSKKSTRVWHNDNADKMKNKYKWYIGRFTFRNIKVKNEKYLLAISKFHCMKCYQEEDNNFKCFNGKVISADYVTMLVNNIDLEYINLIYDYDSYSCDLLYTTTESRQLRYSEVSFVLNSFQQKEESEKGTFEYDLAKVFINAQYGIKVTCPIRSEFIIENGDIEEIEYSRMSRSEQLKLYEELENRGLFSGPMDVYTDGIYITSYAKLQLLTMMVNISELDGQVVYADTDSLKFYSDTNIEGIMDYIENWNKSKIRLNSRNRHFRQYFKDFKVNSKIQDELLKLGIWEVEEDKTSTIFKTLGAKKYIYYTTQGKLKSTIAGCNKKNVPVVFSKMSEKYNISIDKIIDRFFRVGVTFDEDVSGRTVAYRDDRVRSDMDYFSYKGRLINQYGGIIIKKTTYTLGMTESDKDVLDLKGTNTNFKVCVINKDGEVSYNVQNRY